MAEADEKKPLEVLFKHGLELNKKYMNQGLRALMEISKQSKGNKNIFTFQPELYSRAFNAFAKLNLDYYSKVMELSLDMTDEFLKQPNKDEKPEIEPAFVLDAKAKAGESVDLQFVLENTKVDTTTCELVHSAYIYEGSPETNVAVKTTFDPQKFTLESGESCNVTIHIQIPKRAPFGAYTSDVSVLGFEPSFFVIKLIVEPPVRKTSDAKPKKTATKKA